MPRSKICLSVCCGLVVLALAASFLQGQAPHNGSANAPVTFAKDVAPIGQEKCQMCERPGSMAPMSLVPYEDVKRRASTIRSRVHSRTMPPWHIDRTVGIQEFKHDRSLTDAQVNTIVRRIDA